MNPIGLALSSEEHPPNELVRQALLGEMAGFEYALVSDHFHPWTDTQGQSPFVWSVIGGIAQATDRLRLGTGVTCPTVRIHPAVIAHAAATCGAMMPGRFFLGVGSGENLNEHVVGQGWPIVKDRQEMLREAIEIIRELYSGELVDYRGEFFQVDSARIWDLPEQGVEIAVAVGGDRAISELAPLADHLIATEPDAELVEDWNGTQGAPRIGDGARAVGQIPICWDPDKDAAIERAHDQFRWFAGGWAVNSDLPTTSGFAGATQFVRPEDVAGSIPCGPDLDEIVESVKPFWEAGHTDVALVQIGGDTQERFLDEAAGPLLEKLRKASS
jgi:G6PDH family F420-dependent oxidoreductase